jgi:hypothetical protein
MNWACWVRRVSYSPEAIMQMMRSAMRWEVYVARLNEVGLGQSRANGKEM